VVLSVAVMLDIYLCLMGNLAPMWMNARKTQTFVMVVNVKTCLAHTDATVKADL
jgi:hypothetical protein